MECHEQRIANRFRHFCEVAALSFASLAMKAGICPQERASSSIHVAFPRGSDTNSQTVRPNAETAAAVSNGPHARARRRFAGHEKRPVVHHSLFLLLHPFSTIPPLRPATALHTYSALLPRTLPFLPGSSERFTLQL